MFRKNLRLFKDYLRPKRLAIGKFFWDRKADKIKCDIGNIIQAQKIQSILFIRNDGKIGDMVVNVFMFREIKKTFPNVKIGVVTCGEAFYIIEKNKNIDKIYKYKKSEQKKLARKIRKEKYDLLIDFTELLRVYQIQFINLCKARINMGLNKDGWKIFDVSFSHPNISKCHMQDTYINVLKYLGVETRDRSYDLESLSENKPISNNINFPENYIVFNPFAASRYRSFNEKNIKNICKIILEKKSEEIYIIGEKNHEAELKKIVEEIGNKKLNISINENILDVIKLIKNSCLVITPDTAIVHIATAFKKPLIAFYRKDSDGDDNSNLWGPNSDKAKIIFSERFLLPGESPDVNDFDIKEFEKILSEFKIFG
ncbi:MAG: glycosyltransferase family 9 protein [Fusobacteriaceae bacterium]